jgi:glycerol uptake facilitator protein
MSAFVAEIFGTAMLILLGDGVVANILLKRSKGNKGDSNSGWVAITLGWAMAVYIPVYCFYAISGAHINPAVTLGMAIAGKFSWSMVLPYMLAQMIGAMLGAFLVWIAYKKHFDEPNDPDLMLMSFCTAPAIRSYWHNFLTEMIGTFVLIIGLLYLRYPDREVMGGLAALPVGLLILSIGLSLGGPTGYAINPARDLGPRIMHTILPIPGKRDSDWRYAWVPIVGPFIGAALAVLVFFWLGQ